MFRNGGGGGGGAKLGFKFKPKNKSREAVPNVVIAEPRTDDEHPTKKRSKSKECWQPYCDEQYLMQFCKLSLVEIKQKRL